MSRIPSLSTNGKANRPVRRRPNLRLMLAPTFVDSEPDHPADDCGLGSERLSQQYDIQSDQPQQDAAAGAQQQDLEVPPDDFDYGSVEVDEAAVTEAPHTITCDGAPDERVWPDVPADPIMRRPYHEALIKMSELPEDCGETDPFGLEAAIKITIQFDLDGEQQYASVLGYLRHRRANDRTIERWQTDLSYDEVILNSLESEVERGSALAIKNYEVKAIKCADGKSETITVPLRMEAILQQISLACSGWPYRIGNVLFVHDAEHGIHYFDKRGHAGLFGWLKRRRKVDFREREIYCKPAEVMAELERTAPKYGGISLLPHEPMIEGIYYGCGDVEPGDGKHLEQLLDRFRAVSPEDRQLLKAMLMTLVWGGGPGRRPAFVVSSREGRGVGKTSTVEMACRLVGGAIDCSAGEDIAALKARLLTPEAEQYRVAKLDNLKTMRFSWAEWEAMLTADRISGKQMYIGEAQRPNLWTWLITINGVALSTDVAQRCVIIELRRDANPEDWYESTNQLIANHRDAIIADLIAALRARQQPLDRYSRWTSWERDVLCRLPDPGILQQLILSRQSDANVEDDEAAAIQDRFQAGIEYYRRGQADAGVWYIPAPTVAMWISEAIGETIKPAQAGRRLRQLIDEGRLRNLEPGRGRDGSRGYVWRGSRAAAEATASPLVR